MITHLLSRASNEVTSPSDPYAAVDPELIVGPMVRIFSTPRSIGTSCRSISAFLPLADRPRTQHLALRDATHAGGNLLSFQLSVRFLFLSLQELRLNSGFIH